MALKVLTIGGATLDSIISYEQMETMVHQSQGETTSYLLLKEGSKIEVTGHNCCSGGGATNTALSFHRLGFEVSLVCKLGQDPAGDVVLQHLQGYGLPTCDIKRTDQAQTATSFVVPSLGGDRAVFAHRGANATITLDDLSANLIASQDLLYITSLSGPSANCLPQIVHLAQQAGVPVAINPGKSQLKRGGAFLKQALAGIDTLLLNLEEAQQFMHSLLESNSSIADGSKLHSGGFSLKAFFKGVLALGPKVVAVTNGAEGVYVGTNDQLYFHPGRKVKAVNTLGAGDSFGSSFVAAQSLGLGISQALSWGVVNSSMVIAYDDAKTGLQTREQIEQLSHNLSPNLCQISSW